jgi:hypothetical protein
MLLLLDARVDPTADKSYALQMAARHGHHDVVTALLKDGRSNPAAEYNFAI